jgi:glycine oxidase
MERSADVVVVGGGMVGCAVAYFLGEAGAKVLIVERDALGSGASGHGAGGFAVPVHFSEPLEHARFMRHAVNLLKWKAPLIAKETGIDILWRECPWLEVAKDEGTWRYMQEWTPKMAQKTLLDAKEVLRLEPRLSPNILGGCVEEGGGQMDSYRMTLAYAKGAEMRGAEVVIEEVTGLERSGERVTGVVTSKGTIGCDRVVLAMGAWTGFTEKWLDFPMPVSPMKGDLMYLKYKGDEYWPFYISSYDVEDGLELPTVLHKRADGLVVAGVTIEMGLYDSITTDEARNSIIRRAVDLMPCIADSEVVEHMSGPRPSPVDGNTVLGPVPGWEGVYAAVTLPGILCSALMGQIVADLIFERPLPVPIDLYHPKRFAEPVTASFGWNKLMADRPI